jgi:hypothetical protein
MNRILSALITVFMTGLIGAQAQETKGKPQKILVAYFSWSGNTHEMAKRLFRSVRMVADAGGVV